MVRGLCIKQRLMRNCCGDYADCIPETCIGSMHRGFRDRSRRGEVPPAVAGNPSVSRCLPGATVRRHEVTRTRTHQGPPLDLGCRDRARAGAGRPVAAAARSGPPPWIRRWPGGRGVGGLRIHGPGLGAPAGSGRRDDGRPAASGGVGFGQASGGPIGRADMVGCDDRRPRPADMRWQRQVHSRAPVRVQLRYLQRRAL